MHVKAIVLLTETVPSNVMYFLMIPFTDKVIVRDNRSILARGLLKV